MMSHAERNAIYAVAVLLVLFAIYTLWWKKKGCAIKCTPKAPMASGGNPVWASPVNDQGSKFSTFLVFPFVSHGDAMQACKTTPITYQGVLYRHPDNCSTRPDGRYWGTWTKRQTGSEGFAGCPGGCA